MMIFREIIRVPADRIGVIVGRKGRVKRRIERLTNTTLSIDHEGVVTITPPQDPEGAILVWKARDIVRAIARGFSPKHAFRLIDEDARLIIISLRDFIGNSPNQRRRVAGRIIGMNGRTRRIIEETTDTLVSVYGKTVSIIGIDPGLEYAQRAITMLITGAPHATVYSWLEKMRRELNRQNAELWESDL